MDPKMFETPGDWMFHIMTLPDRSALAYDYYRWMLRKKYPNGVPSYLLNRVL